MKRVIEKSISLPSYKLTIDQLGAMYGELRSQFANDNVLGNIELDLKGERIQFESFQELKENISSIPAVLQDVSISINEYRNNKRVSIHSGYTSQRLRITGTDEAWCSGLNGIVQKYIRENRRWYFWIKNWYFLVLGSVSGMTPILSDKLLHFQNKISIFSTFAWFFLAIVFFTSLFAFEKIFPSQIIVAKSEENFLKKYSSEITILFAAASLVVSLIALLKK